MAQNNIQNLVKRGKKLLITIHPLSTNIHNILTLPYILMYNQNYR